MLVCLATLQGAMMGIEISLLPNFGHWTDAIHGAVLGGGMLLAPITGLVVMARVYRYVLMALAWVLGK